MNDFQATYTPPSPPAAIQTAGWMVTTMMVLQNLGSDRSSALYSVSTEPWGAPPVSLSPAYLYKGGQRMLNRMPGFLVLGEAAFSQFGPIAPQNKNEIDALLLSARQPCYLWDAKG